MTHSHDTSCSVIYELSRDAGIEIPDHDPSRYLERMYLLADWAVRCMLPAMLAHGGPGAAAFQGHAQTLRGLDQIRTAAQAQAAVKLLRRFSGELSSYRDGSLNPPLKQAYWLCLSAAECEAGRAPAGAYGASGMLDLAESMGIGRDSALTTLIGILL